jgi:anti-sigma regulatory factor (Ser/Thr protein kinase)
MAGQEENTRNAVETAKENYQVPWRVIHEALQNSLDAIYENGEDGKITVTLDISDQRAEVRDDGVGFPHGEDGIRLLGLHGTNKGEDTRQGGNLGYGIKTVICSTERFKLESVREGKEWGFVVENGMDIANSTFTEIEESSVDNAEPGTSVSYSFPNDEVTKALNEIYESTPGVQRLNKFDSTVKYISSKNDYPDILRSLFEWYFRTKTYAANIDRLLKGDDSNVPKVDITFKIKVSDDDEVDNLNEDIDDIIRLNDGSISVEFENKYWDIENLFLRSDGSSKSGLPFSIVNDVNLPIPETQELKFEQVVVFKFTDEEEYKQLIRYPSGKYAGEVDDRDSDYYKNKLFNVLEGVYIVVGRKRYLDMMLFPDNPDRKTTFARGIPTQDHLTLESGQWGSSRSETTVVVGLYVSDTLNLGKLQLSYRRRIKWLREYYTDTFKAHIRRISSQVASKQITEEDDLNLPDDEEENTDFVDREKIFDSGGPDRSIIVKPHYENELIALFFDLLGSQEIDGYQFYGLSGRARFDGKTEVKLPTRDYFRSSISQDSKLWNIEFKVRLSVLANDLENVKSRKRASQLQLAVVWEIDSENISKQTDFGVVDIQNFDSVSGMSFPSSKILKGVEKVLAVRVEERWIPIQILEMRSVVSSMKEESE